MTQSRRVQRAERLLALHHGAKLLILPNIWDPLGARLLQGLGFPAVATASAAVAYSLGYDDGEQITFEAMLDVIHRVVASVEVPVTADIERGYAEDLPGLSANVRAVVCAGAAGINLEDGMSGGGRLRSIDSQCERIRAARAAADGEGVPLVINARTDVYLQESSMTPSARLEQAIGRARAYREAGADCVYPILLCDLAGLTSFVSETGSPVNVFVGPATPSVPELEAAGIKRLSVGPGLLKAAMGAMKDAALGLKDSGSYNALTTNVMPSEEIQNLVSSDKMEKRP